MKNNIYPCLWFDPETGSAQAAADFYCAAFKDAKITTDAGIVVSLELYEQKLLLLNGGPEFRPNPSISLFVICRSEDEVETLWKNMSPGSEVMMPLDTYDWSPKYGWLQDKFGVSWQLMLEEPSYTQQKIVPLFFFTGKNHGKAEEAIRFYLSVFKNTKSHGILKYTDEDQNDYAKGTVKHAQFELDAYTFMAMDSGVENDYPFTEGVSIMVECKNQEEIDAYWDQLTADGGEESMCGWLKDKCGLSWQILPDTLMSMVTHPDKERAKRVMDAFMQMKKFDIATLKKTFGENP